MHRELLELVRRAGLQTLPSPYGEGPGNLPSPSGRGAGGEGRVPTENGNRPHSGGGTDCQSVLRHISTENGNRPHPSPLPKGEGTGLGPLPKGEGTDLGPLSEGEGTFASPLPEGEGTRSAHRVKQGRTDRRQYDNVHRAILTGLLSSVALRGDGYEYSVAGGGKGHIWPGSGVFAQRPKWLVAAEVVETTRRYLRTCGRIDPRLDRADRRARGEAVVSRRALGAGPGLGHGPGAGHADGPDDRRRAADPLRADRPDYLPPPDDRAGPGRGPHRAQAGLPRGRTKSWSPSWTGSRRSCGAATCWRATLPATSSTTAACRPRSTTAPPWRNGCGPIRTP